MVAMPCHATYATLLDVVCHAEAMEGMGTLPPTSLLLSPSLPLTAEEKPPRGPSVRLGPR